MKNRLPAVILLFAGIFVLLNSLNIITFSRLFLVLISAFLILFILVLFLFSKYKLFTKTKNIILNFEIKNSINKININGKTIAYIGFKLVGKKNVNDQQLDYSEELKQLVETISRHKDRRLKIVILTSFDPLPGSGIAFYTEVDSSYKDEDFIKEVNTLKNMLESVAPHISLEISQVNLNMFVPLMKVTGALIYNGYVFEKRYTIPDSEILLQNHDIELGEVINNYGIQTGFNSKDVLRHISIFGSTGSGKTNSAALISKELLKKGFDVVILDWHGEYKHILPEFKVYSRRNILTLNPIPLDEQDTEDIIDIFKDTLELTEPQSFILYLVIEQLKRYRKLDTDTLKIILESIQTDSYMIRDIKFALGRKLYLLTTPLARKLFSLDTGYTYYDIGEKLSGGNIIDLSFIYNLKLRRLYSLFMMKFLFTFYERSNNSDRKILLVIEEAHNYFNNKNEMLKRALQEIRKYNVSLCIITQSPSSIDEEVIKNTNIKIIHTIKSNIDKRIISDSLSLDKDQLQLLDKLDVGEAILVSPNIRSHSIIKVKKVT
ncbi:ATP-binding protein [Sulfolobus acidocaldarius]|uniref:Conserved Archaeal protein n=4 Tax=Sulfolobus acidocaldarius TaxID=2285 RepID=Q4JAX8_SULAC|nr:DUF87 domain-containing protein [Sulfolobus acidocaldarius]AAY80051.1 conserved Archaeal protein [Sulfolobus acidocaldarius DSM 639]AGE70622.1 hypothetical protein SacN8_03225 [Sulfolobus acidocaldarius N8]AGE72895.1 hypothetical protein SacRon12I_03215 [Sulfolobus acidocaldarius Ron12/I]ALU29026.1 hypothetical protein ATY89_03065 [Sulfolobus acidocaldarius]ALU31753.1 hypothetical protein ATZ20_06090 [Sulfolobus acidocaldarius]